MFPCIPRCLKKNAIQSSIPSVSSSESHPFAFKQSIVGTKTCSRCFGGTWASVVTTGITYHQMSRFSTQQKRGTKNRHLGRSQVPPQKKIGKLHKQMVQKSKVFFYNWKNTVKRPRPLPSSDSSSSSAPLPSFSHNNPPRSGSCVFSKRPKLLQFVWHPQWSPEKIHGNFTTQKKKYGNIFPRKNGHFRRQKSFLTDLLLLLFGVVWGKDPPDLRICHSKIRPEQMGLLGDFFMAQGPLRDKTRWSQMLRARNLEPRVQLVGGFNPSEKYQSKWESSPSRGENKKYLKPPPS